MKIKIPFTCPNCEKEYHELLIIEWGLADNRIQCECGKEISVSITLEISIEE